MKKFFRSGDGASKGAALLIVLALVVLVTGLALAYLTRTTTDRELAQSSYNDTSADLLARSALDIIAGDFKQEILSHPTVTPGPPFYITPVPYGTPTCGSTCIPNLVRRSVSGVGATSNISSTSSSANGRSISLARWNSHYLIPRATPGPGQDWNTVYTDPVPSFTPPDWVLVTGQGPTPSPAPNAVIGRYAFAVYDEGGLLDMNVAGYPNWPNTTTCGTTPSPTPWLVNVGRKGTVAFADLSVLASPSPTTSPNINNIVGWRNYAMTQRTPPASFPNFNFSTETDCNGRGKQDFYGSYLLYFGDPPFIVDSVADKLTASLYPFTTVAAQPDLSNTRTDQRLTTRQQLLRLQRALDNPVGQFSQNLLQYMGTFSRERNWPAPDWPGLNGSLSAGRFNLNNLGLVLPNPADCFIAHGRKVGWQTGKNKNHLCGNAPELNELFGLFWVKSEVITPCSTGTCPGEWRYIGNVSSLPDPNATPTPKPGVDCLRPANRQSDFFQVLNFALFGNQCGPGPDANLAKVFGIGASLIDQYDSALYDSSSGTGCPPSGPNSSHTQPAGCDLDAHAVGSNWNKQTNATHTTAILYGRGNGNAIHAYGMELNNSSDSINGDDPWQGNCSAIQAGNNPHRPCNAPTPTTGTTQVISHGFSTVGEFGYGIDTSTPGTPILDFSSPTYRDAGVLDFFSYNPISSAYPRAGIVNLYTRNAPVLAAILSQSLRTDAAANAVPSPSPVILPAQATDAANLIVAETNRILSGQAPLWGPVTQTDMTRAIAARLIAAGAAAPSWNGFTTEGKEAIVRALAEVGQTRTWNLMIDVIAQTGKYKPGSADLSSSNFVVEGEKRYWLHVALGRDLVCPDGRPYGPNDPNSCSLSQATVDVLGTQLEEVTE